MRRRTWLTWLLKRGGAAVVFLSVLAYCASYVWYVHWATSARECTIVSGWVIYSDVAWRRDPGFQCGWNFDRLSRHFQAWSTYAPSPASGPVRTLGTYLGFGFEAPLWPALLVLFAAIGVPTAILSWRDRRLPPGHCRKCGYNLTGNVSGRCPECGTPATDPPQGPPDAARTGVPHDP